MPKPELIEFVPNAFFKPRVRFKNESTFELLSSGEQQYYNAINTIVYHILNLDSIDKHYTRINILFDEIELYFHPEFQRRFTWDLLQSLKNLKLDKIKDINIVFSTHSPFILSDIPSQNVLRLENGEPSKKTIQETFGANIHDLLANDFFLEKGFMGEFAKDKINKVISTLNEDSIIDEPDKIIENKMIIDLIGEPIIQNRLKQLFSLYYPAFANQNDDLDARIRKQEDLLRYLENQRKKRDEKNS